MKKFKVGSRLACKGSGTELDGEYILAQVASQQMCVISLRDGNRWNDPVKVESSLFVTLEELSQMLLSSGSGERWYTKGRKSPLQLNKPSK